MTSSRTHLVLLTAAAALGLTACGGGIDAAIGGSLSGLAAGASVTLQDNAGSSLTLNANGSFAFLTKVAASSPYSVTVLTQPAGQVCAIAKASGTVNSAADDVNTVSVTCVSTASIGGTVSGLAVGTAVTLINGTVLLPVATNGAFAFPGTVVAGTAYDVAVAVQPAGQNCTIANGTGIFEAGTVTNITVTCS
jgi:hypothetical protein